MRKVYFDECGNTGQNLLDPADPIFVLASCSFQEDEEKKALAHFQQFNGPELKFSRLRNTPSGQRALLSFLSSPEVTAQTAAAVVFHKPFMVVTKYCDLVLEPFYRKGGVDFYARGANIAIANLLTTTMPVFLSKTTWSDFLSLFVRVLRERTASIYQDWRRLTELIYALLEHEQPDAANFFIPVISSPDCEELFKTLGEDELDPLVPAYAVVVDHWGKSLRDSYEVVADESKVLARSRGRLLALSNPDIKSVSAGYDRRRMEFPFKVSDIIAVDSKAFHQVQLADIVSGALTNTIKARTKGALEAGTFPHTVLELCTTKKIIVEAVWPNHEVDPADLGTDIEPGPDEIDLPTHAAMILKGHPATRKSGESPIPRS